MRLYQGEERHRETETETDRQRQTDRETDRQTERKKETDRQRQTETERQRENHFEVDEFSFTGPFRQWVSCPCRPLNRTRTLTVAVLAPFSAKNDPKLTHQQNALATAADR